MAIPEQTCPRCEMPVPSNTAVCPGCGEDLAGLLHLVYAHVTYYNEALGLARQGERERARESALMSLRLRPNYAPSLALIARLAAQEAHWDQAREYAARAKALAPNDPDLDALFSAIDEAEAEDRAKQDSSSPEQERERRDSAERAMAARQRDVLQAALVGVLMGGVVSEVVRWLLGRSAERKG